MADTKSRSHRFLHSFGLQRDRTVQTESFESPSQPEPSTVQQSIDDKDTLASKGDHPHAEPFTAIERAYTAHAARVTRLETLERLHDALGSLIKSFTFPRELDFARPPTKGEAGVVPDLAYTRRNVGFREHEQALLRLLSEADAVSSEGDEEVRVKRKEFVEAVQHELELLEEGRLRVWQGQMAGV